MPTITKRVGKKGITYKVQVRKRGYLPETASFLTLAAAQHWARSAETAMDNGQFVRSKNAEKTSLHAALQRYAEEEIPKKSHPKKELSFIKFWQAQAVAKLPLASQRSSDYASLRGAWLRAGLKPSTVTRRLNVLSHVFTVARKEWRFESLTNPLLDVSRPAITDGRERVLKKQPRFTNDFSNGDVEDGLGEDRENLNDELQRLLRASKSPYLAAAANFAVETAMRRSEITSLQWADVDMKKFVAHLPVTKNGSPRDVPLSPLAITILESLDTTLHAKVFPMTSDALSRAFTRAQDRAREQYLHECRAMGEAPDENFLSGLRFHDLRHEATTRLAKLFEMHELAKITGHSTTRMLLRYYHPKAEELAMRFRNT